MIGSRIVAEAARRGHTVTGVSRSARGVDGASQMIARDASDPGAALDIAREHDVLVLATRPAPGDEHAVRAVTRTVLAAAETAGRRVVVIGGSAPLTHPSGHGRVIDDPSLVPAEWQPSARASLEQHAECQQSSADWIYLSPPAVISPGTRTGRYTLGADTLLVDSTHGSRISAEDFAVMTVDRVEATPDGIRHLTAVSTV